MSIYRRLTFLNHHLNSTSALSVSARSMSSSSNNSNLNRSGLAPEASKKLSARQATSEEQKVIDAVSELYKCKPSSAAYSVYAETAVFHDPVGIADGLKLIQAQFNALPKLFEKSTIDRLVVLENPALPKSTILIDQDVSYYRKADSSPTKTINSLLTLERDSNGKITRHTEEWDHKRETDSSDGWLGRLNELRKTMTAKITGAAVSSDPPKA